MFDPWNISFGVVKGTASAETYALCIDVSESGPDSLEDGDIVTAINNVSLGSAGAANLQEILSLLREATSFEIRVSRVSQKVMNKPNSEE